MMKKVHIVFCMDTEGPCDDPKNSDLLKNWKAVDKAMDKLFSNKFRNYKPDYLGNNFKIGWFFLTWTGFKTNPRGRDFGYHKVRDHYIKRWGEKINNYGHSIDIEIEAKAKELAVQKYLSEQNKLLESYIPL